MDNITLKNIDSRSIVKRAARNKRGDTLNAELYGLALRFPDHTSKDQIYAKVVIIGRTYSAAIDRGAGHDKENGHFYWDVVIPALWTERNSIDTMLRKLPRGQTVTLENLPMVLKTHGKIVAILENAVARMPAKKVRQYRSFVSKYLHFHRPELFFIFDSLARKSLVKYDMSQSRTNTSDCDRDYEKFCRKCLALRDAIYLEHGIHLTPRALDNLLLDKD